MGVIGVALGGHAFRDATPFGAAFYLAIIATILSLAVAGLLADANRALAGGVGTRTALLASTGSSIPAVHVTTVEAQYGAPAVVPGGDGSGSMYGLAPQQPYQAVPHQQPYQAVPQPGYYQVPGMAPPMYPGYGGAPALYPGQPYPQYQPSAQPPAPSAGSYQDGASAPSVSKE